MQTVASNLAKHAIAQKHAFHRISEVVGVYHVSLHDDDYRIEIHKNYTNANTPYTATYFVRHVVGLGKGRAAGSDEMQAYLLDVSLPWVAEDSADAALEQALTFLEERKRSHA